MQSALLRFPLLKKASNFKILFQMNTMMVVNGHQSNIIVYEVDSFYCCNWALLINKADK